MRRGFLREVCRNRLCGRWMCGGSCAGSFRLENHRCIRGTTPGCHRVEAPRRANQSHSQATQARHGRDTSGIHPHWQGRWRKGTLSRCARSRKMVCDHRCDADGPGGNPGSNKEQMSGSNRNPMNGIKKQNLPEKICPQCQRPFAWRKKWEREWESVRYCSDACRRGKITRKA